MSRQRFDTIIGLILDIEGGYANDPNDPGGETKYGISKRSYPHLDIKNLTIPDAKEIYYQDWWKPLRCPEIHDARIGQKLLNIAIHSGRCNGVKVLQRALCDVGEPVVVDGIIGPKTLAATNRANPDQLWKAMCYQQAQFYKWLIGRNPNLARYERGWMKRANL